jgi:hypothetical protein
MRWRWWTDLESTNPCCSYKMRPRDAHQIHLNYDAMLQIGSRVVVVVSWWFGLRLLGQDFSIQKQVWSCSNQSLCVVAIDILSRDRVPLMKFFLRANFDVVDVGSGYDFAPRHRFKPNEAWSNFEDAKFTFLSQKASPFSRKKRAWNGWDRGESWVAERQQKRKEY